MEIRDKFSSLNAISSMSQLKVSNLKEQEIKNSTKQREPSEEEFAQEISEEETIEAVEILNDTMKLYNHKLHFEIHEDTQRMKVAVVDRITDEVIKEIPPEEMLDMLAKIQDMIGILIDKRI